VERDEHNQPTDTPGGESDWSIDDFDDFVGFDDLAGDAEPAQPSLDFGGGADEQPAADRHGETAPVEPPVPGSESPPRRPASPTDAEDRADADAADDTGADEVASDDEEAHASASPAPVADDEPQASEDDEPPASEDDEPPAAATGSDDWSDEPAVFGFEAPVEPEASMARPARSAPPPPAHAPEPEIFDQEEELDFSSFTQEQYVKATTQEYAGLAEEVARHATEATEQMAVSAGIPGLESGVVGLDDVVGQVEDQDVVGPPRSGSDLSVRVLTAVGLVAIFFGSLYQDYLIAILIFAVMLVSAAEMYVVLTRSGHRPMTLFGLLGVGWALFGTWYWGMIAIPVSLALTTVATLVFFGVVAHRKQPLLDTALTLLVVAWIGALGAPAMDIAFAPDYAWMVAAIVIITALMDIAQYFVGRRLGKRALAPEISPKKTIEGLVGGVVVALGVGAVLGNFGPFSLTDGLLLGGIVAVAGPIGDLAVSVVKRAIGVKDMGAILPGHGGVLDRIDAMIFVIPVAWVAYSWMGLIVG
jgi:CDP-diglyceride synthetase